MISDSKNERNEKFKIDPFFNLSLDLMCIAGFDGYFKRVNPSVSKILGFSEQELYSKPIIEFVHPKDRERTSKGRENIISSVPLLDFENRYITKEGNAVWLSWTSIPMPESELVYAIAKNVTHKKREERNRNLLLSKLTERNKDLKQINFSTSHDLRSPISNLQTIISMIDSSKIEDNETNEFLEIIEQVTLGLVKTLNNKIDLLSNNEKIGVLLEQLSLNEVLNEVMNSISALIRNSNAQFTIDFTSAETVFFNKDYLESIFLNLITNSIKYKKPSSNPTIRIVSRKLDGKTILSYSDKGIGFDMEKVKDRIFGLNQKFTDKTDSKGIGLYLVHNQITSLGGTISLESELNAGTTFTLSFKE